MKEFLFFGSPLKKGEQDWLLLFLRLFVGIIMLSHGIPKLVHFNELATTFADPIGLGSTFALLLALSAEIGCSLLLILGVFTRLAALILVINMFVAAFIAHAGDPFKMKELAIMYLAFYIMLFCTGAGKYAVDHLIGQKCKK